MKKDYAQMMMNPVKVRILQQIAMSVEIDAKQIATKMPDIPTSSLYRHLADLTELGAIKVVAETPMRGTIKKTYAMNRDFAKENPTGEELGAMVQYALCVISGEMQNYFQQKDVDLQRDCINLSNAVLELTKEEYGECQKEIMEVMKKYINLPKSEERMTRRITFVSSPVMEAKKEEGKNGSN